jgi:hypothetical protein
LPQVLDENDSVHSSEFFTSALPSDPGGSSGIEESGAEMLGLNLLWIVLFSGAHSWAPPGFPAETAE